MVTATQATLYDRLRLVRTAERLNRPLRFGLGVAIVFLTALLRHLLLAHEAPWFLFVPAVMAVALGLGSGPAVVATALSAAAAALAASPSRQPSNLTPVLWVASALFVVVTLALISVVQALRSTLLDMEALLREQVQDRAALAERGSFLSGVLASSTDCIKVLDLEGNLTFMSDEGQKVMEVSDFNAIAGCPWPDFWRGQGNADAVAALRSAREGGTKTFIGQAETMKGTSKWWHVAVSPILGPDGRPERILSVSRDISELRESEAERDRYVRVIETSTDFIGLARLDGSVFFLNEAARRLVGLEPEEVAQVRVADFFAPEQADAISTEIFPAVEREGSWSGERLFRHFKTGELIPVLYTVFPVQDAGGQLLGFGTVTRDDREHKRAEERQAVLNGEISHRLKNILAMVQALASQTLRGSTTPEALKAFGERLAALSKAQDTLLRGEWDATDLKTVACETLDLAGVMKRCALSGPPVPLGSRAALSASLLFHELGTNAHKYGALSRPDGHVTLAWHIEGDGETAEVVVCWREHGGPPAVAPTRKGFGSRLLKLGLVGTGGSDLLFSQDGFAATFRAPLEQVERA